MCIELKDWILFIAGIVLGFFFSIALYWWPLGQFINECKALWNLSRNKFKKGDEIVIKAGTDLKSFDGLSKILFVPSDSKMMIWNDEGVNWFHHSSKGWVRARVLHVCKLNTGSIEPVYKACHFDIKFN